MAVFGKYMFLLCNFLTISDLNNNPLYAYCE